MEHATLDEQVLAYMKTAKLASIGEIKAQIAANPNSVVTCVQRLVKSGKVLRVVKGAYCIHPFDGQTADDIFSQISKRTATQNKRTLNILMNLYDKILEAVSETIERVHDDETLDACIVRFQLLTRTIDPLLKRWQIVHQGYDANTRQAQEDAKEKAEKKEARKATKSEETVTVVGKYHVELEEVWDSYPPAQGAELKEKTDKEPPV